MVPGWVDFYQSAARSSVFVEFFMNSYVVGILVISPVKRK